jgi:hypothetical protein
MSPIRFEYSSENWSHREMRTRGHVERAANIQRRAQSQVRGWSEEQPERNSLSKDRRNNHEQRRRDFAS